MPILARTRRSCIKLDWNSALHGLATDISARGGRLHYLVVGFTNSVFIRLVTFNQPRVRRQAGESGYIMVMVVFVVRVGSARACVESDTAGSTP